MPTGKKSEKSSLDRLLSRLSSPEAKGIAEARSAKIAASEKSERLSSRTAEVARWERARELMPEEKERIDTLTAIIGKGNTELAIDEQLSQAEIDLLMMEEISRRSTENIIKGRYNAIRRAILNHVSAMNGGDQFATGQVISAANGYLFDITKTERGGSEDLNLLENVVTPEVWSMITDEITVREVNEDKLAVALNNGIVTKEQFLSAFPPKTVSRNFTIKPIKEDEE